MKKLMLLISVIAITSIAECQQTIPTFFEELIEEYTYKFNAKYHNKYLELCKINNIDPLDTGNFKKFYTIFTLHKLFTNRPDELKNLINMPYIYNWCVPNPRKEIIFLKTGEKLKNTPPPKGFSNYKTYAEVDRTPYLLLSDLFNNTPKYYSNVFDTIYSFCWCSEREMAFTSILKCIGYKHAKIMVAYGHAVSRCIITMKNNNNELDSIEISIDNTFNNISLWKFEDNINQWEKEFGSYKLGTWYNTAIKNDLFRIKEHVVSNKSKKRIYKEVNSSME